MRRFHVRGKPVPDLRFAAGSSVIIGQYRPAVRAPVFFIPAGSVYHQ